MILQTIIFIIGLSVGIAYPTDGLIAYEKLEDVNGYQWFLIPVNDFGSISRIKRQTSDPATDSGLGSSQLQSFLSFDHQLDSTNFLNKQYSLPPTDLLAPKRHTLFSYNNDHNLLDSTSFLNKQYGQSSGTVTDSGFGFSHREPLLDYNDHQVGATGSLNKQYYGPTTMGGSLDYLHKPSGSGVSLGGSHSTQGMGNDLTATGKYKFFESGDGRTSATASGHVNQHFGGPEGTNGRSYGAGLTLEHKF